MHRMLVLYGHPKDPEHFRNYYLNTHLPIAAKMPGIKGARHSFEVAALGADKSPYICAFEADFDSAEALFAALTSPEGQATAADVPNYATGGVTMLHYPI